MSLHDDGHNNATGGTHGRVSVLRETKHFGNVYVLSYVVLRGCATTS